MNRPTAQPGYAQRQQRQQLMADWIAQQLDRQREAVTTQADTLVRVEFAVQSVADNHLVCKHFDGTQAWGDDVIVAKDPELRRSAYDGLTLTGEEGDLEYSYTSPTRRSVTKDPGGENEETKDQVILPFYHTAADGPEDYPGSIISAFSTLITIDGVGECQWVEDTQRAWANLEEEETP